MSYLTELKERDIAMTPRQGYYNEGEYLWECLVCDSAVEEGTNFCHQCGQRFIKEDQMMREIEYIVNNKIYNLTKSTKLYEYEEREGAGRFVNHYEITRTVRVELYRTLKGNLYQTVSRNGRITITDITEEDLKKVLFQRNEVDLLRKLFPEDIEKLEEV